MEKERKLKEDERKKSSAILEERMKQPLQGNLALHFLFRDQDIGEIIKMKPTGGEHKTGKQLQSMTAEQLLKEFNMTEEEIRERIDITKFNGYFKKKISHQIGNLNDFIHKMRKTAVLQKFFSENDVEFAGVKELFRVLYEKMEAFILEEPGMCDDLRMHLEEIHEFIMFQLHQDFFANTQPSPDEINFQNKYLSLVNYTPAAFGIPASIDMESPEMKFAWKLAIRQL